MAQKELRAKVIIGGEVDSTFNVLGDTLTKMGSSVNEISQKLIDFGKTSAQVYRSYEDSMLEAEGALATTYGRGTTTLKDKMKDLNAYAQQWASTTIFHTNDVANAINEAAHANWDYEQIISGIPVAMRLAQAGGMDLSQALDYVITSTKAAGIGFEDLGDWIDVWSFAANSSAGTIEEFGQAMERMGNTMQFTDSKEELVTLLAVLHNTGTKGAAAGTLLRNSMIRLIAPTEKAAEAMDALEITEADVAEAMNESTGDMEAAQEALEAVGFSAYDEEGKLKGFIDIFTELNTAVSGMSEQNRNNVLSAIFPTRTISGALAFLDAASKGFDGLYASMEAGDAQGYSEYLSELMMSGMTGSTETMLSKIEELELLVGETLAPTIEKVQGFIGEIVDGISGMDDTKFSAIVTGLTTLAAAGPAMMGAGVAMKFIGSVLSPTGAFGMGVATLVSIISAVNDLKESDFASNFGEMSLDSKTLGTYIKSLGDDFNTAFTNVDAFAGALAEATTNYETASTTFASDLLNAVLTKKEFTTEEKDALQKKGAEIYGYVVDSINASFDKGAEFWNVLYGGEGVAENDPMYQKLIGTLATGRDSAIGQAEAVGERIKKALVDGLASGFTDADYQEILDAMREYNALVAQAEAEAQSEEAFVQQKMLLHKAQTASLDEVKGLADEARTQRDKYIEKREEDFWHAYYQQQISGADEGMLASAAEQYEEWKTQYEAGYDEIIATLWETQIQQSDLGDAYGQLRQYAGLYMNGALSPDTIMGLITAEMGKSQYAGQGGLSTIFGSETEREELGRTLSTIIDDLGGMEEIASRINIHRELGDQYMADKLGQILAMEQLVNGFTNYKWTEQPGFLGMSYGFATEGAFTHEGKDGPLNVSYSTQERNRATMGNLYGLGGGGYSTAAAKAVLDALGSDAVTAHLNAAMNGATLDELQQSWAEIGQAERDALTEVMGSLASEYDFSRVMWGNGRFQQGDIGYNEYAMQKLLSMGEGAEAYRKSAEGADIIQDSIGSLTTEMSAYLNALTSGADSATVEQAWKDVVSSGQRESFNQIVSAIKSGYDLVAANKGETSNYADSRSPYAEHYAVSNLIGMGSQGAAQYAKSGYTVEGAQEAANAAFTEAQGTFDSLGTLKSGVEVTGASAAASAAHSEAQAYANANPVYFHTELVGGGGGGATTASMQKMASGGRADRPVVFGEAGPEWFIPEERTGRTADLILAAAKASGFTLAELAERAGGRMFAEGGTTGTALSWSSMPETSTESSSSSSGIQVQYSPVIHADNANGVDRVLKEDKKRLQKWMEDWRERKKLYNSMVAYQ